MKAINKLKNKKYFLPALAMLIIVVSAVGYASWSRSKQTTVTTAASAMQTSRARSGNLTVSASGSGTLVASRETALSFSTSGVVATLNVITLKKDKFWQNLEI
jgi:HlyD family secretion protein